MVCISPKTGVALTVILKIVVKKCLLIVLYYSVYYSYSYLKPV